MKNFFTFLFTALTVNAIAQSVPKYNLDFEERGTDSLAQNWIKWGTNPVSVDSISAHRGKYMAVVTSEDEGTAFGSMAYRIPANYEGDSISLEGYMKIEDVSGYAGLLLRVDGKGRSLVFDNMGKQGIKGTRDWQKYSITLPFPKDGENIFVAGIMQGKGKAWFDDFTVRIDGVDLQVREEIEKEVLQATLDKEFDAGSGIEFPALTDRMITDLTLLGKMWGFLKYHHPEVAKGNYNWDYELLRILPQFLEIKNNTERDNVLLTWIDKYGEIQQCVACRETTPDAFAVPDHSWISNSGMGTKLQKKLNSIYKSRNNEEHFHLEFGKGVGNPQFNNENPYSKMSYPDDGFRLLALYKYWNMIQYFFPNRHLTDKDWNLVLEEYIPTFLHAENELEYELAAVQIIGEIQDTHADLWGGGDKIEEMRGDKYAPVQVRFIEDQLVVTDYFNPEMQAEVGLKVGDVITHLNGKKVEDLVAELRPYYPASNNASQLRNISLDILRSNEEEINIKYLSEAGVQERALKLFDREDLDYYHLYRSGDQQTYEVLDGNIGYVTLESITKEDFKPIKEQFRNTDGIIIDIRNYPSTSAVFDLGPFFTSNEVPFVKFTSGSLATPGEFNYIDTYNIPGSEDAYKGKLVVLVNEITQSHAEFTAMAFRATGNTTIVGSTTSGADGNVSTIFLPGGLRTMISGIGVYYPDGTETQRVGIVPDVEVKPTIAGIKAGRDELVEKAVEIIKSGVARK